jgi:GxxExxY protein
MRLSATSATSHRQSSKISQGDREIGSRASENFGFTHCSAIFGTTQPTIDRWARMAREKSWDISEQVIGACIEVHRVLGPGLLESVYEAALCEELTIRQLPFKRQSVLPVEYKGRLLEQSYRADLIVAEQLLLEVKSVEALLFVHVAQVVTYLRITNLPAGLIVNFNTALLRDGLRRVSLNNNKNSHDSRSPDLPVKSRPAKGLQ